MKKKTQFLYIYMEIKRYSFHQMLKKNSTKHTLKTLVLMC